MLIAITQEPVTATSQQAQTLGTSAGSVEDRALPAVGLITIWYRAAESDIERYVASLRAQTYSRLLPVFVIHDQPGPDVERLKRDVPYALVIDAGGNLGTSAGWNLGIRHLLLEGVAYIGIWNVDVRYAPDCVERLVAQMECDPTIGAVSPLLFYSDMPQVVQMYGGSLNLHTGVMCHDLNGAIDLAHLPSLRDVSYLDGGTMLVRSEALRLVGGFDETLFMYLEDSDFSVRLRRCGYRTVAIRDAHAWHYHREQKGLITPPHVVFYITRNRLHFVRKHAGAAAWLLVLARQMALLPRLLIFLLRRGQIAQARATVAGLWYAIIGRRGKQGWVA